MDMPLALQVRLIAGLGFLPSVALNPATVGVTGANAGIATGAFLVSVTALAWWRSRSR
jgi:hypothetical protein